jgi:hypothetical protein
MMIEGSGSRAGFGSWRPKNTWIRIGNTVNSMRKHNIVIKTALLPISVVDPDAVDPRPIGLLDPNPDMDPY